MLPYGSTDLILIYAKVRHQAESQASLPPFVHVPIWMDIYGYHHLVTIHTTTGRVGLPYRHIAIASGKCGNHAESNPQQTMKTSTGRLFVKGIIGASIGLTFEIFVLGYHGLSRRMWQNILGELIGKTPFSHPDGRSPFIPTRSYISLRILFTQSRGPLPSQQPSGEVRRAE
jgi:hypothetical protein